MPWFRVSPTEAWVLIHVPKTGGTSISEYWSHRFHQPLSRATLYAPEPTTLLPPGNVFPCPPQHLPYRLLWRWAPAWSFSRRGWRVLAAVRHTYTRLLSDLMHFRLLTPDTSPEDVFLRVKEHVHANPEGHAFPQHWFVQRPDDPLAPPVTIVHTETLTEDLRALGWTDFDLRLNASSSSSSSSSSSFRPDPDRLLTDEACAWIDRVYAEDFRQFGYPTRGENAFFHRV